MFAHHKSTLKRKSDPPWAHKVDFRGCDVDLKRDEEEEEKKEKNEEKQKGIIVLSGNSTNGISGVSSGSQTFALDDLGRQLLVLELNLKSQLKCLFNEMLITSENRETKHTRPVFIKTWKSASEAEQRSLISRYGNLVKKGNIFVLRFV